MLLWRELTLSQPKARWSSGLFAQNETSPSQEEMTTGSRVLLWSCEGSTFRPFLGQNSSLGLQLSHTPGEFFDVWSRKHFLSLAHFSREHFKGFVFILIQNKTPFYVWIVFLHRWILDFCSAWRSRSFLAPVLGETGLILHGTGGPEEENKLCQSTGKLRTKLEDILVFKGVSEIPDLEIWSRARICKWAQVQ